MNISKIILEHFTEANGRFPQEYWEIIINYYDGTHDIFAVFTIDEVLKFIEEHKK